MKTYITVR